MLGKTQEEIENKIIDLVALEAEDRLVAFKPEKTGKDLAIEKRGDYNKKANFLNVYWVEAHGKENFIDKIKEIVQSKDFIPEENFYLLFTTFDVIEQKIKDSFFVIPSLQVKENFSEEDMSKFLMDGKNFIRFLIDLSEKK